MLVGEGVFEKYLFFILWVGVFWLVISSGGSSVFGWSLGFSCCWLWDEFGVDFLGVVVFLKVVEFKLGGFFLLWLGREFLCGR